MVQAHLCCRTPQEPSAASQHDPSLWCQPTCTVETWFYTLRKEMTEQKILFFSSSSSSFCFNQTNRKSKVVP